MAATVKLTKVLVENAQIPPTGQEFLRDNEITGFALRITSSGGRSFIWEGRVKRRMRRITLGRYPDISVQIARQKAQAIRGELANGRDPAQERRIARDELTFADLTEAYVERHAKQHKSSWKRDVQMLRAYLAKWRSRKLSDISPDEIDRLHKNIGEEHGHYAANRTIALLRAMFNLAHDWGFSKADNPAARIKPYREQKRERFLSPDELRRVNEALIGEPNQYWRGYFVLSLLLGPRRSELLAARWADIDLVQRSWHLPTTKSGRSHLLPLPEAAVEILQALPSREREFVFPGTGATGHLTEPKKAWRRIRTRAGVPDARIHDLRRTLGSWLAASGHSLPLIGRVLNHSNASTTQIYARLSLDPVREALEKNSALMLGRVMPGK
jgi:integrase